MEKTHQSSSDSPFQRFQKLAKALFAVPKKATDEKATELRPKSGKRKRAQV